MANIATKSSALAIKKETTEGTPVSPTASGDYVKLQDDFSMEPSVESLDNAELSSSIGSSKSIQGAESPSASFSHYMRASGVEGQEPNFGPILEALFGSVSVRSTERDTVAGSTTSALNVDTGEGSEFFRGAVLMIKDATNGYRVRFVDGVSTDTLSLGFNVPTAPSSGVNLGKGISYLPTNSGHPTLNLWHYIGNQGAVQMMSGARPTTMTIDISAGQLINANYSFEGLEYFFNPIEITATSKFIDFDDGGGQENVAVAEKFYKDPHQLADAIADAMNAATTDTITVTYSDSTGKFTIATDGVTLSLLWNTGTNTANSIASSIGFSAAADDTGSTSYLGDSALDYSSPQTATYDDSDPLAAKGHEVMIGDATDYVCFNANTISVSYNNTRSIEESVCATSGQNGSLFSARDMEITVSSLLQQNDADKFKKFRENGNIKFQYTGGLKTGTNWTAGRVFAVYSPTSTITSLNIDDLDGQAQLNMTLKPYVDSNGQGEFYLGMV